MELQTLSHGVYYPNLKLSLWYNEKEELTGHLALGERLLLAFIEKGTVSISIGDKKLLVMAPSILCLDEQTQITREQALDLQARSFYFHPCFINSQFNFDNLRQKDAFSGTARNDTGWLRAFLKPQQNYGGLISLSFTMQQHITSLFAKTNTELMAQRDNYWPCRTRSFFLELLMYIDQLYSESTKQEEVKLWDFPKTAAASDTDLYREDTREASITKIILYLHTNYYEEITIDKLTKLFNINRTTLTEIFKKATNFTAMSYLIRLRIKIAATMLHDTRIPVCEIAERVGFKDLTHFGRTFRHITGLTPSEYRNSYCWVK